MTENCGLDEIFIFLSLVPTERDQKLYLLRNFLPQYSLLTFLSEMGKLFSPPQGVDHGKSRKLRLFRFF